METSCNKKKKRGYIGFPYGMEANKYEMTELQFLGELKELSRFGRMYYSIPGRTSCPQDVHDCDLPSTLGSGSPSADIILLCICERLTAGNLLNLYCHRVFMWQELG